MSDLDPMPPPDGRTTGAAVAPFLASQGVDTVFGIPGVHNVELYRGLHATTIRHVLARHEQGAGFMADGYARITGRPGVCFVISGPGLSNILTPVGQAVSDSIPVLVVGAVRETGQLGARARGLHEIGEQLKVAAPLTGYAATANGVAEVPLRLAEALASFTGQRPRPAFVELPLDVMVASCEPARWSLPFVGDHDPVGGLPDASAIGEVADRITVAERPVLLVGGGAIGARTLLRRLVDEYAVAVLPTIAGKGVVDDSHALSLGATLPQPATLEWLATADLVIAVGTELAPTDSWQPMLPVQGTLVRIDIDPQMLSTDYSTHYAWHCDAVVALSALLAALAGRDAPPDRAGRLQGELATVAATIVAGEDVEQRRRRQVLDTLREAIPPASAVYTDMTMLAYSGNEVFSVSEPRSWFHPVGYGTLGYAIPAAIGAKLACPDRPIVALAGDYGFGYTSQELLVAAEYQLPLPVIIWNSENLGAIEADMRLKNIPPTAVVALNPDFEQLAKAYHCEYERPPTLTALSACITRALMADSPTLIEVRPALAQGYDRTASGPSLKSG